MIKTYYNLATSHVLEMMAIAETIANFSKDPRKGVGAVISIDKRLVSSGRNGFPTGFEDKNLYTNLSAEEKNIITTHAEANAITFCAKHGIDVSGGEMFISYPPCHECCKLIIGSGIKTVYYKWEDEFTKSKWYKRYCVGIMLLLMAGIKVFELTGQNELNVISSYSISGDLTQKVKELNDVNKPDAGHRNTWDETKYQGITDCLGVI